MKLSIWQPYVVNSKDTLGAVTWITENNINSKQSIFCYGQKLKSCYDELMIKYFLPS